MSPLRTALGTTGWGLYCACSWTWCIGMFLPAILLGRYGWPGFLVFAAVNVAGCTAFGYVLRTGECSREVVRRHRPAMQLFSLVTVAYHVFFLGVLCWLLLPVGEPGTPREQTLWIALAAPVVVLVLGQVLADVPTRLWPGIAVGIYGLSLLVFATLGAQPLTEIAWSGNDPTLHVAWLAPVMAFGFLLCPYLDATFHRALQESPSHHAFAVFGISFAVMILLSCVYWDVMSTGLSWLVLAHIVAQTVFTIGAHLREGVRGSVGDDRDMPGIARRLVMLLPLIALPIALLGAFTLDPLATSVENYLRFLVFYALVFPAYTMMFMGRSAFAVTRRAAVLLALACIAFAPMYEAGFLHGQAWILVVPPIVFALWRARRRVDLGRRLPEAQDGAGERA